MKKYLILFLFAFCMRDAVAQESFQRAGLLCFHGTIAPGLRAGYNKPVIYLQGIDEYFFNERFSLRGEAWFQVVKGTYPDLHYSHSTLAGGSWHLLPNHKFDPYFGCSAGLAYSAANVKNISPVDQSYIYSKRAVHVDPILAPHVGLRLFSEKYFHVFAEAEYVIGNYLPPGFEGKSLNELRFSFGLGFQLQTKRT